MTEAASLNFGPAWLRDSFTSNTGSGEGPPGSGGSGGPLNYNSQQNNSGWDIASSRSSHGHGGKSNNLQQSTQSNHQMNLHVGGQQSSGASSILSALKLAEHRYGREEMLALYPAGLLQDTSTSNSALMLDADILEAMETTSLLVPDRRPLQPLNVMGAVSEEEQRAWARGANSDTSLRIYSKQKGISGLMEDGLAGRGRIEGVSIKGDHRGGLPERGRGRGVGRGGGINAGGPFFDRHRSDDPITDESGIGIRGPNGGRGIGSSDIGGDGARPFGGGRGTRGFERSISGGSSWYAERSNSNGPASAGIIGPAASEESTNNGSMSPRKGYTRAPFDDWRKPPTDREEDGEGGGWRNSGTGPSGRRWNAPAPGGANNGSGTSQGWRASDDGYRGGGKYDREYVNGNSRWREDGSNESHYFRSRGGSFSAANRGSFSSSSFSRQRSRQDSDLPEWALDDDADGRVPAGGTFDSSGKFRAPSSESPPPLQSREYTSPKESPNLQRKNLNENIEHPAEENHFSSSFQNQSEDTSQSNKPSAENYANPYDDGLEINSGKMFPERVGIRGRGSNREKSEAHLIHGHMETNYSKEQLNNERTIEIEDDSRFEDEEVDVDDLPPDVRKDTLRQRQQQRLQEESYENSIKNNVQPNTSERDDMFHSREKHFSKDSHSHSSQNKTHHHSMSHEMDDALVDSLVDSLVNDDESSSPTVPIVSEHHMSTNASPNISSSIISNRNHPIPQETILGSGVAVSEQMRVDHSTQQEETVWYYLDPQGNKQGPFSNSDMLDWFNAGYFPTELMLRRSVDKRFVQLLEMTKLYERVPFATGPWPNIPPPLEDIDELEKQTQEAEKRQREQQNVMFQQLQQQAMLQQQLQLQQQRLFTIQQQHQGPDKAAIEQALANQATATAQAIQQQQQIIQKMMQNMSLFQHQTSNSPANQILNEQHEKQLSDSTKMRVSDNQNDLHGPDLGGMLHKQNVLQTEGQQFTRQHVETSQSEQQQHTAFSLGLSSPVLKAHLTENSPQDNSRSPRPQQSTAVSGMIGAPLTSLSNPNHGGMPNVGYDPIKSLLTQLQQSDQPSSTARPGNISDESSISGPSTNQQMGYRGKETHRSIEDQPEPAPLNGAIPTDSPHMGRSIWDMPAATVAAPLTSNSAPSREQQDHQILHHRQPQHIMQQQPAESEKGRIQGWDQVRAGLMEDQQQKTRQEYEHNAEHSWPIQHELLPPHNTELSGQNYITPPSSGSAQHNTQEFENTPTNENQGISMTTDSFRQDDLPDTEVKNDFNGNNSNPKMKDNRKEKKEKLKRDTRRSEKSITTNNNQQEFCTSDNYIPGMEGAIKPDVPITATKSMEEEQQRAQADALYRLQLEQQQMLERERAVAEEKAAKQRQESLQSAAKLAPWAKKTGGTINPHERGIHSSSSDTDQYHIGDDASLSLAEIQRLEEERERERKIQKEIEDQQIREQRMKQEQEEQLRRQQGKGMNWASTAASGMNNGPNSGKSLAEIQAEEEEHERRRQERERLQKKERQKEMGLAQASVWGSASSNLSWASKAASVGVATASPNITNPATPQSTPKLNHQGSKPPSLVSSSTAPWSSTTNSNSGAGGFWDDAAPPPGLSSNNTNHSNKNKKKPASKEAQKNNMKAAKEDAKVAQIFRENSAKNTPRQNEFEAWCSSALANLNGQVDIPTFMAFLKDIESPYEVNDYVKIYLGDGKGPKNFAKEYLERRSKYKNSLKCASQNLEDDLLTPAHAINPNREAENDGMGSGIGSGPMAGPHGIAGGKSKKKGKGSGKTSKFGDASHLLGFSVASERVNAGDIDVPQ